MKKVVYHINDSLQWQTVINNVSNMIAFYKEASIHYQIDIIANGSAVAFLTQSKSDYVHSLENLATQDIHICACQNSLHGLNIDNSTVYPFVTIIPSGVITLAERQFEGYAYIKP